MREVVTGYRRLGFKKDEGACDSGGRKSGAHGGSLACSRPTGLKRALVAARESCIHWENVKSSPTLWDHGMAIKIN